MPAIREETVHAVSGRNLPAGSRISMKLVDEHFDDAEHCDFI
jgi:hypothetical protein